MKAKPTKKNSKKKNVPTQSLASWGGSHHSDSMVESSSLTPLKGLVSGSSDVPKNLMQCKSVRSKGTILLSG